MSNFDRVQHKSKTNGTIGSEMRVSFCKNRPRGAHSIIITGKFVSQCVEQGAEIRQMSGM
ncbi:hypothetical protein CEQ31_016000 [Serratia odorifera]|nr:hypothetical protein CEQ31_016000 [Serratia odorifera]RII72105.1 hypothetical protein DX901_10385 [Serratia odorifera]